MGSNANTVAVAVADAKFLRLVLFALMGLTVLTGVLTVMTTVEAMSPNPLSCVFICQ